MHGPGHEQVGVRELTKLCFDPDKKFNCHSRRKWLGAKLQLSKFHEYVVTTQVQSKDTITEVMPVYDDFASQ